MANTAQVNQPLSQHPLPWALHRVLGAGGGVLKGLLPNSDTLVIPPPAASPNGQVLRAFDFWALMNLFNNTVPGVLAAVPPDFNFRLIYKDEDGNEVIIGENDLALAANGTAVVQPNAFFLLNADDQGIFLRLGNLQEVGPVPFTGSIDGHIAFTDVRDATRVDVDLTTSFQTILTGAQGKARLLAPATGNIPGPVFGAIFNFDNVDHTIEARLSDGVNTIALPGFATSPVPAGNTVSLNTNNIALLEGWEFQMRTTVAPAVDPVRVNMTYTDTNLSPVRSDQGGAY